MIEFNIEGDHLNFGLYMKFDFNHGPVVSAMKIFQNADSQRTDIQTLRPNKKIPVFRVIQPYLNLLMKPRFFSGFLGKNII